MNPVNINSPQGPANFTYPAIGGAPNNIPVTPTQASSAAPVNPATPTDPASVTPASTLPAAPIGVPQYQAETQTVSAAGMPAENLSIPMDVENPVDEPSVDVEEKKSNPLQALADKLTNLKDEIVNEEPSSVASEPVAPQAVPDQQINPSLPPTKPMPVVMPVEQAPLNPAPITPLNDLSTSQPLSTSPAPTVTPVVLETPVVPAPDVGKSLEQILKEEELNSGTAEVVSTDGPYPYTIDQLLDLVVERDASDLHITVGYPAMIRVDGALQNVSEQIVTAEQATDLILPVLPEQKKELLEVNREVDLAYAHGEDARFRINAYYQKQTLAGAFRLIPNRIRSVDELKLPQIYHQITKLKQGLVLVTGPTGSGKSTTLAAILQEINLTRPDHMITIEDPIEYIFPKAKAMVDQREMHEDTHSWEIALKSALRQDPDVMLVGEMRDFETIASAITLAETGHLVFATLHTNNAAQTVDRIIDVFPEHQQPQVRSQLSHVIEAVIAQRLIPLPSGGRMAVSEIMLANPAVRNLIREAKTHQLDNVIRTSADIGMVSLEHSLVKLVRENVITMDLAQEYAVHPEEVVRLLKS